MAKTVLVTGPNGVGKSRLITELTARYGGRYRHVRGSRMLMQWCGVDDYDGLRSLPDDVKVQAENDGMARLISDHGTHGDGTVQLIDCHVLHCRDGVGTPYVQPWMRQVDAVIILSTDPSTLHRRIARDLTTTGRRRDCFLVGMTLEERLTAIENFLAESWRLAVELANGCQIPWHSAMNKGTRPQVLARRVDAFLGEVFVATPQVACAAGPQYATAPAVAAAV